MSGRSTPSAAMEAFQASYDERVKSRFRMWFNSNYDSNHTQTEEALERIKAEEALCSCPLVNEPNIGPHSEIEHRKDSCGGVSTPEPCGGCYDCLLAQVQGDDTFERVRLLMLPKKDLVLMLSDQRATLAMTREQLRDVQGRYTKLRRQLDDADKLAGDESALTEVQRKRWVGLSRVEAIRQAEQSFDAHMQLHHTFNDVRAQRDAAQDALDGALTNIKHFLEALANLTASMVETYNGMRHAADPVRAKLQDDMDGMVTAGVSEEDVELDAAERLMNEIEVAAGLRDPDEDVEDFRSPGVEY